MLSIEFLKKLQTNNFIIYFLIILYQVHIFPIYFFLFFIILILISFYPFILISIFNLLVLLLFYYLFSIIKLFPTQLTSYS